MTRARPSAVSAVVLAGVALSAGGCGFIFSHGPPEGYEAMDRVRCTESIAPPVLDLVWGGLNLIGVLAIAADPGAYTNSGEAIAGGVLWIALSGSAAAVGFNKAKRCREARNVVADREGRNRELADSIAFARQAVRSRGAVQAVVISPHADTLAVGQRVQLVASAHASSGAAVPGGTFRWSSSNEAIVSVSAAGLATANSPGTAVIAAGTGDVVGTATIVVVAPR